MSAAMRPPVAGCSTSSGVQPGAHRPLLASRSRRAALKPAATAAPSFTAESNGKPAAPVINLIPKSRWADGVPPVMGAHLMASGSVAPISTSKGPGIDVAPPPFEYPGAANTQVVVYATPKQAAAGLTKAVTAAAKAAISAKGSFTLVLSGGSLPASITGLADVRDIDWSKVLVFWVDERNVPHSSSDSNYKGATEALLGNVPIPAANIYAIHENLPVEQAAINYEGRLVALPPSTLPRNADGWPVFDTILLGVGPDGHVASLFPNRPQLAEAKAWVLPVSASPKPPPERITFTLPVINAAKQIFVVALGEGKAEIVQRVLEVQSLPGALPAQLVRPGEGSTLKWVLDAASAQHLDFEEWEGNSRAFPRSQ